MQFGMKADISGHSSYINDTPMTLPEGYRVYRRRHQTFPDFRAEFLEALPRFHKHLGSPEVKNLLAYFGDDTEYTIH